jgi:HK97 family phage major capsid protein
MSVDVFSQRRMNVANQLRDILASRGPLPAYKKEVLRGLVEEAESLESGIKIEHEKREDVAFSKYLRAGKDQLSAEDKRLIREARDMTEAGLATGIATGPGILVPVGFERAVVSAMRDFSPLLQIANVVPVDNGRPHPYPADLDEALSGELLPEGLQATTADINQPSQIILNSYKFSSKIVRVSRELLTDEEVTFPSYLARILGIRLARIMSQMFTTGTGTAQPLGFMNGTSIVNAGAAAGASASDGSSSSASIGVADASLLMSAVNVSYWRNAKFCVHETTLQAMMSQLDKNGRWLWPGLHNSPDGVSRILNHEIITNPAMDTLQATASSPPITRKPMVFADFSKYTIRRCPMVLWKLEERWAEFFQVGFLAMIRADGNWTDLGACAAYIETVY